MEQKILLIVPSGADLVKIEQIKEMIEKGHPTYEVEIQWQNGHVDPQALMQELDGHDSATRARLQALVDKVVTIQHGDEHMQFSLEPSYPAVGGDPKHIPRGERVPHLRRAGYLGRRAR